jgi:phosphatidylserine/phosphatidylglycerophosphate/cardiolipin synthase-like enzyme
MREVPDLKFIVVTKPVGYWDTGRKWTAIEAARFQQEFPDRFLLLTMKASDFRTSAGDVHGKFADVDIHSKMFIVDDRIMSFGSCNKNERGMVYEGEANLLIRDEAWVGEQRRRIWNRLVGPGFEDQVDDPATAFELFSSIAERNQRVFDLWDDRDGEIPADRFNESLLPQGILFPLDVPYEWWFDVGPDFS